MLWYHESEKSPDWKGKVCQHKLEQKAVGGYHTRAAVETVSEPITEIVTGTEDGAQTCAPLLEMRGMDLQMKCPLSGHSYKKEQFYPLSFDQSFYYNQNLTIFFCIISLKNF